MKFITTLLLLVLISFANAQSLKEKLIAQSNGQILMSTELPKGMKLYDEKTFSDTSGVSGVYYTKEPVRFFYYNTMNALKAFGVNQITIEYDPAYHTARLHVVNDELKKKIRREGIDQTKAWEMDNGHGTQLSEVAKKKGLYAFNTFCSKYYNCPSYDYAGFTDVMVMENINDPGVWLIGFANVVDEAKGIYEIRDLSNRNTIGGYFNIMSKDPKKLEGYDSARIAKDMIATRDAVLRGENETYAASSDLPKQIADDDDREAEYTDLIRTAASSDKPVAWGDKLSYAYIASDWKIVKSNGVVSHRWCTVIATSTGWKDGNGKYIPCIIKENYDGTSYGAPYFGGFKGSLIPISVEKINSFEH